MTIIASIFAWVLLYWKSGSSKKEETEKPAPKDDFLDTLAAAAPRHTPKDLYQVILSPALSQYDECDLVNLMQDVAQTYIRPGMGQEEVNHVKTAFVKVSGALSLLQSNRLYGGTNGQYKNP